jgi:CarD family transcriptional regulator
LYQIGDKVVHPMHGAGVIDSIVQRKVSGRVQEFYLLKLSVGNMVVMVPTDNTGEIGMRPVVSGAKAEELMSEMEGIEVDMTQNWNRRYRENMVRLKSGDLLEVARVVKGLLRRDSQRGLSNGERKMLHTAKQILISELVLAQSLPYDAVESSINSLLSH